MARISTYTAATLSDDDLLIGTDGGTGRAGSGGRTRNFQLSNLRTFFNGSTTDRHIPFLDGGSLTDSPIEIDSRDRLCIDSDVIFKGQLLNEEGESVLAGTGGGGGGGLISVATDATIDGLGTAENPLSIDTESIQDIVGAMFTDNNTETGISVVYQDTDGTIDLTVTSTQNNAQPYATEVINAQSASRELSGFTTYVIVPPTGTMPTTSRTVSATINAPAVTVGFNAATATIVASTGPIVGLQIGDTATVTTSQTVSGNPVEVTFTVTNIDNANRATNANFDVSVSPTGTDINSGGAGTYGNIEFGRDVTTQNTNTNGGMFNLPTGSNLIDGMWIKVVNVTGTTNVILDAGTGVRFMNDARINPASTLQLTNARATFELVYVANLGNQNLPVGWVIIGSE